MDCWPNPGAAPSPLAGWGQELTLQLLGGKDSSSRAPAGAGVPRVPRVSAALATALDVGLSNWSFLYITVSL